MFAKKVGRDCLQMINWLTPYSLLLAAGLLTVVATRLSADGMSDASESLCSITNPRDTNASTWLGISNQDGPLSNALGALLVSAITTCNPPGATKLAMLSTRPLSTEIYE